MGHRCFCFMTTGLRVYRRGAGARSFVEERMFSDREREGKGRRCETSTIQI